MLAPGHILQRGYAIEQRLGYGRIGAVYRARYIHLDRLVAIKFTFGVQPDDERLFQREAQVPASLTHPALPGVTDYFEEGGCYYLVMEYIRGKNLHTYLGLDQPPGQRLGEAETLNLITPVLDALEYMHNQKPPIIHRDIKPRNIVITPENKVYLVDFGLAKAYEANRVNSVTINHITPGYSPPEQYSQQTDMRSDLYSVGATLYTMLTGTIPPDALSLERGTQSLRSLRDQNPDVSARLEDAIFQLMTLNPIHRQRGLRLLKPALGETVRNNSRPLEPALGESPPADAAPSQHQAPPRPAQPQRSHPASLPSWVPDMVKIPAGPFLMGSSDADTLARDDEKPQHRLELPTYWIGRTPVTNAQFRPFVAGDGYRNRDYWTEAGWAWREEDKIVKPQYWDDPQWNGDDYPVVGVSWFEAVAYCRWLEAQTGIPFQLPTEAEWEKAARGPDGLIWPWGNTWKEGLCNSKEAGIGKTTLVGNYPKGASPSGALDMAGNVWEWCATKWRKDYPYTVEDEWTAEYLAGDNGRMLRGGSWVIRRGFVRGALRYDNNPRFRYNRYGLRLARHSPLPGSNE
jgi:formylglycine-generating enzyme required for sulfatase activity/predicted Ser/Thr protein kinase